jgi:chromate transporter
MNDITTAPTRGPTGEGPSALRLFAIFARIGMTSFGGGLSGLLLRVFVHDYRWLSEEEFLDGLAIAQALPGVNVANMAVWIGYRLRGSIGAFASLAGIIIPPAILIVALAAVFSSLRDFELTHVLLTGAGAAAIGLSLVMGITAARRVPRRALPIAIMTATFLAVAIFRLPLIWVVLIGSPISILLAARSPR